MEELFALIAFVSGIPMIIVGYIWCLVVSKNVSSGWLLANLFVIPLIAFGMMHWRKVRVPLIVLVIGIALVYYTLESVPQG